MNNRRRQGFMVLDAVLGITLLAALGLVLTMALAQHRKASDSLAQRRMALSLAQATLHALQSGAPLPGDDAARIDVAEVDADGPAPGVVWVSVHVRVDQQQVHLVGPVVRAATTRLAAGDGASRREGRP